MMFNGASERELSDPRGKGLHTCNYITIGRVFNTIQ